MSYNSHYLASFLLIILISLVSIYTDLNYGQVYNKHLAGYFALLILIDTAVFSPVHQFNQISFYILGRLLLNFVLCFSLSFLLYINKLWGAGDAKLFALLILALPYDFFMVESYNFFPGFLILALSFGLAFVYLILETLVFFIRDVYKRDFSCKDLKRDFRLEKIIFIAGSYFSSFLISSLTVNVINYLGPAWLNTNKSLVLTINLCLVFVVLRINKKKLLYLFDFLGLICLFLKGIRSLSSLHTISLSLESTFIFLIIVLVRYLGKKYNYKEIPIDKIKSGMMLSIDTLMLLAIAKVKGVSFEIDRLENERLKENDIADLNKWSKSRTGKNSVTIVRQIPFAPFICLASLIFFLINIQS